MKTGVDDFIVAQGPDVFGALLTNTAPWTDEAAQENLRQFNEINAQYALVMIGKDAMIADSGADSLVARSPVFRTIAAVRAALANRHVQLPGRRSPVPLFDYWLAHPRRPTYVGIDFDPSGHQVPGILNTFVGFPVAPSKRKCNLFLKHVLDVICAGNISHYQYVMAWLADAVQHPERKPGVALVLRGGQGVGKGKFAEWIGLLFGPYYVQLNNQRHLTGHFNRLLADKLFLFADESFFVGDKAARAVLYGIVTEAILLIEPKGVDAYAQKNYIRLLMASNHDHVVPAEGDARRFFVLYVSDVRKEDFDYFAALDEQMRSGGLEALMYHLLYEVDVSKVNLRLAPRTTALVDQKIASLEGVERFWLDYLRRTDEATWTTEIDCASLHTAYAEAIGQTGERRRALETELGSSLSKLVPHLGRVRRLVGGRQRRMFVLPSLTACRDALAARLNCDAADLFESQVKVGRRLRRVK